MIEQEALAFWQLCQKLRSMQSEAGRAMVLYVDIPAFLGRATNPRIINQLKEIIDDKQESTGS